MGAAPYIECGSHALPFRKEEKICPSDAPAPGGLSFCAAEKSVGEGRRKSRKYIRKVLDRLCNPAYLRPPKRGALRIDARSSNGKRADSDSVNQGSSPCRASIFTLKSIDMRRGYVALDGIALYVPLSAPLIIRLVQPDCWQRCC